MGQVGAAYRGHVNPVQFERFLDGQGAGANRAALAEAFDYDWHARKLSFRQHLRGHVLMQATTYRSTRDHQWAAAHDPLFAACGAGVEISVSGLAQANKHRPVEPLVVLLRQLLDAVAALPHRRLRALDKQTWRGIVQLLGRTNLLDATTLRLPPKLRDWAPGKKGQAALKLQLCLGAHSGALKRLLLTPEPGGDSVYLDQLLGDLRAQPAQLFVFDAGYLNSARFQQIVASGHDFVTKASGALRPQRLERRPLPTVEPTSGYEVLTDELVTLRTPSATPYRLLHVRLTTGKELRLLSSLLDAPANQICLLYRYRWTIEIVFRWLRQHLQLDHFMSHHPRGVLRQLLTALIVWTLLILANQDASRLSPKQLWRQLTADLHRVLLEFGYRLGSQQLSLPAPPTYE